MEEISQNRILSHVSNQGSSLSTAKELVRYRAACDRCHGKKIRCQKEPDTKSCIECTKHTIDCRFTIFRKDVRRPLSPQRKKRASVESQLNGLKEHITASREGSHSLIPFGESARKRKSPLPDSSDPDIESLETQWQSSPDLSTSNWNCNDLLLYRDLTVENSFDNLDFGNSFSQPHAPQPGCPPNNFDQSDVPLPTFDPLDMARIDVTQRAYNSIAVPDMECYGSKDSINPLRIFLDRPCIQNLQLDAQSELPTLVLPGKQPPSHQRKNPSYPKENDSNININVMCHMSEVDLFSSLNKLNLNLYKHKAVIPPLSVHDLNFANDPAMRQNRENYKGYSVEDTFQFTQELVDLYPSFFETFLRNKSIVPAISELAGKPQEGDSDANVYRRTIIQQGISTREPPARTLASVDHSSVFLLVSCHTCLIDIWEDIVQHMSHCIKHAGTDQADVFNPPALKIGKYTPPPSVAFSMQMLMIIQMSSHLSGHADTLVTCLKGVRSETEVRQSDNHEIVANVNIMSLSAAKAVQARAHKISHKLIEIRNDFLDSALFT